MTNIDLPVGVAICTRNNVHDLDATIESLRMVKYDPAKLFINIVDFGSTDGTLEKILLYPKKNLGFYCCSHGRVGRTMIADAARIGDSALFSSIHLVLQPGDIVYPDALRMLIETQRRASSTKFPCRMVIGDVDIAEENGKIRRQAPLFDSPCVFRQGDPSTPLEFAKLGYRHRILVCGMRSTIKNKTYTQLNQQYWWNAMLGWSTIANLAYLNEPVACIRERAYADELDELAFKFETGISFARQAKESRETISMNDDVLPNYNFQLARHALWRAWLAYKRGDLKTADDCSLFAQVIHLPIEREEYFSRTRMLVGNVDADAGRWLEEYYTGEQETFSAKYPIGAS